MTFTITTTLHDVEVELEESDVLSEISTSDIVEHLKDNNDTDELLSEMDSSDIIKYLTDAGQEEEMLDEIGRPEIVDHLVNNTDLLAEALAKLEPKDRARLLPEPSPVVLPLDDALKTLAERYGKAAVAIKALEIALITTAPEQPPVAVAPVAEHLN